MLIAARIRNVGTTVRHMPPAVATAPAGVGWFCEPLGPRLEGVPRCPGPGLAPGTRADLRQKFALNDSRAPKIVELASEGPDTNPTDNRGRLKPWLRLRTRDRRGLTPRATRALRRALRSNQRATVALAARARDATGNRSRLAKRTIIVR